MTAAEVVSTPASPPVTLADSYEHCQRITREEAANFSYGIRLLPPARRSALSAVYALARQIDDIADGDLPAADKLARLDAMRARVHAASTSRDPVLRAVADTARRLPVPMAAFDELIDGARMDVTGREYADAEELVGYCRLVAGSVGRLCLGVFGSRPHPRAASYADSLGVALQLTNILRDIREDLLSGRVYLPAADLERHGVTLRLGRDGALADDDGRLSELVRELATRAEAWYVEGLRLLPLLDGRAAACTATMAGIYHRLLARIAAHPRTVLDRRLSLTTAEKAAVAARALVGRTA